MRILVTGATGFIGSHFANTAIAAGHEVIAVCRRGSRPRVPVSDRVRWVEKPLADVVSADCEGIETLASFSSQGVSAPETTWMDAYRHNVLDQLSVLQAAADAKVRRFVICGTCLEYGATAEQFERTPASAALRPVGAYASSKAAGFMAAHSFARDRAVGMAYLRLFHSFGEGQHPDAFWPSLRAAALSGADYRMTPGQQVRAFTAVADVARTFLDVCINHPLPPGLPEVHNVGSGQPATLLAFAERWWREWGARGRLLPGALPYRKGEVMRFVPELTLRYTPA
jgi:nucleoside-diphosphate-sugar epimerase